MRPIFNESWASLFRERRERRVAMFHTLWDQSQRFQAELQKVVPRHQAFHHALEMRGDLEGALATGVLPALRREKFAETRAEHSTSEKLRQGCKVWTLRWVGHGAMAVDRSGDEPATDLQWHHVLLHVRVDRETRRIDTEFYSLNEEAGDNANAYDDREKLHAVWCVPDDVSSPLQLAYLGFGTNEPYDLDHPDRSASALSGRPRFYIHDQDHRVVLRYEVGWSDPRPFDWDWAHRPVLHDARGLKVEFVRLCDGSLFCVSDREVADAASGLTEEVMLELAELPDKLNAQQARIDAYVQGPIEHRIDARHPAPTLDEILARAGTDYVPYFAASAAARTTARSPAELIRALRRLEPKRAEEYRFLETLCRDALVPDAASQLPERLIDLFELDREQLDPDTASAVGAWVARISDEIDRDLYHYGQSPAERIHRLRLGVWLATRDEHGNLYRGVLAAARSYVETGSCHGRFDLDWSSLPDPE